MIANYGWQFMSRSDGIYFCEFLPENLALFSELASFDISLLISPKQSPPEPFLIHQKFKKNYLFKINLIYCLQINSYVCHVTVTFDERFA